MKIFEVICVAFLPLVLAQGPFAPPGFEDCKTKTGATNDDLQVFRKHGVPTTKTGACFMACMGKKMGMMNDDNSFNLDKASEMISRLKNLPPLPGAPADLPSKMETVFKTCKEKEKVVSDECEAAKTMAQCFSDQKKALGLPDFPPSP